MVIRRGAAPYALSSWRAVASTSSVAPSGSRARWRRRSGSPSPSGAHLLVHHHGTGRGLVVSKRSMSPTLRSACASAFRAARMGTCEHQHRISARPPTAMERSAPGLEPLERALPLRASHHGCRAFPIPGSCRCRPPSSLNTASSGEGENPRWCPACGCSSRRDRRESPDLHWKDISREK